MARFLSLTLTIWKADCVLMPANGPLPMATLRGLRATASRMISTLAIKFG